jgi:flagellar motor switch/type III secretory pathway protein FliN
MAAAAAPASAATTPAMNPAPARGSERETVDDEARWKPVLGLPCQLIVDLPLPDFKIADLLKLRSGSVINAHWRLGRDVPLQLNGLLIGWSEFEVVGSNLAVRLTELA